jgi:hypothetical protein
MNDVTTFPEKYKPSFHGHETFPLRYGWLEKGHHIVENRGEHTFVSDAGIETAIADLGVGRNMVKAIRHWGIAAGFFELNDGILKNSETSKTLLDSENGKDPYLESMTSLWKIHYEMVKSPKNTLLHWMFNYFNETVFDKSLMFNRLMEFMDKNEMPVSDKKADTIHKDITVALATYCPKKNTAQKDDDISSPLAELNLIKLSEDNRYSFNLGEKRTLENKLIISCLIDFWETKSAGSKQTLKFENALHDPNSPGRIFLMSETDLSERLSKIEEITNGAVSWSETAGIQQLSIRPRANKSDLLCLWEECLS